MQMPSVLARRTVAVSGGPSAAGARGARTRPAALTADSAPRKRRRVCIIGIGNLPFLCLRLQLAFELVEEAPIGAVGDDLLRARLDEAQFAQTQGIESNRDLGLVFAAFVVRQTAESLQRVIVSFCKAAIDETSRSTRRLGRAQIGRL